MMNLMFLLKCLGCIIAGNILYMLISPKDFRPSIVIDVAMISIIAFVTAIYFEIKSLHRA